jgi:hypothetical protein
MVAIMTGYNRRDMKGRCDEIYNVAGFFHVRGLSSLSKLP